MRFLMILLLQQAEFLCYRYINARHLTGTMPIYKSIACIIAIELLQEPGDKQLSHPHVDQHDTAHRMHILQL